MLTYSVCSKKCIHVKINLKNLIQRKKTKHTPSGYSLFANFSFDTTKNKLDCYKGEDCVERLCKDLRNHAMKISNSEGKEKIPLTNKENKKNKKFVTHAKKNLVLMKMIKMNLNYTIK